MRSSVEQGLQQSHCRDDIAPWQSIIGIEVEDDDVPGVRASCSATPTDASPARPAAAGRRPLRWSWPSCTWRDPGSPRSRSLRCLEQCARGHAFDRSTACSSRSGSAPGSTGGLRCEAATSPRDGGVIEREVALGQLALRKQQLLGMGQCDASNAIARSFRCASARVSARVARLAVVFAGPAACFVAVVFAGPAACFEAVVFAGPAACFVAVVFAGPAASSAPALVAVAMVVAAPAVLVVTVALRATLFFAAVLPAAPAGCVPAAAAFSATDLFECHSRSGSAVISSRLRPLATLSGRFSAWASLPCRANSSSALMRNAVALRWDCAGRAHENPVAVQLFAVKTKLELAFPIGSARVALFRRPGAAVPKQHRTRAVLIRRDHVRSFPYSIGWSSTCMASPAFLR